MYSQSIWSLVAQLASSSHLEVDSIVSEVLERCEPNVRYNEVAKAGNESSSKRQDTVEIR